MRTNECNLQFGQTKGASAEKLHFWHNTIRRMDQTQPPPVGPEIKNGIRFQQDFMYLKGSFLRISRKGNKRCLLYCQNNERNSAVFASDIN